MRTFTAGLPNNKEGVDSDHDKTGASGAYRGEAAAQLRPRAGGRGRRCAVSGLRIGGAGHSFRPPAGERGADAGRGRPAGALFIPGVSPGPLSDEKRL
ncbi:hypothetical protein SDC9_91715 [bioreactor metagenome]|uniref:Uncharacterized protein n=1 Tax=bioreactor metagenome TaxID=1076179 RepID=A0A644ZVN6_9ZZZZ